MTTDPRRWTVEDGEAGERLDVHVAGRLGCTRGGARRLIEAGGVLVGGRPARRGALVAAGQRITVEHLPPTEENLRPLGEPDLPLDVLLADGRVVAVSKPAGMPSHPLLPGETGTLAGALVARFPDCSGVGDDPREAGLVHRLDRDTSGVLLAARDAEAWSFLRAAFHEGRSRKTYLALVVGEVGAPRVVDRPLRHLPSDRRRMVVADEGSEGAQEARSEIRPLASADGMSLVEVTLASGRMHQIRTHLAHIGHPLVGDPLYGGPPREGGHFLHAARLVCPHPGGGQIDVVAPLPEDRARLLREAGLIGIDDAGC